MKGRPLHLLFAALLLLLPAVAFAQGQISGTVRDATTSEPLPGVNVILNGTSIGTATDFSGNYTLAVPSLTDTLVFSYIGYELAMEAIGGRTQIDMLLVETVYSVGEELVVTGYGSQERRTITGSVANLGEEDFVSGNVNTPAELIQGKVAGLQITTRNGNPNDNIEIRLRGISSFGANQSPLVVVDGVIGASLENLDTNDIETIDVLKDASAAAIYGTRGSAGVILVTTKKGEARRGVSVDYSAYYTFEGIENKLDVLTGEEYRKLSRDTGLNAPDLGHNTVWFEEVTQQGSNMVHSLALSGGNENTVYRASGNFRDRNGIQRYTGFQEISGRLNLTQWAMDHNLELSIQLAATTKEQNFGFADAFKFAGIMNPTAPVKADGFENTGGYFEQPLFNYFNPVAIIEEGTRVGERKHFSGSFRGEYDMGGLTEGLSGLSFALSYSYQTLDRVNRNFYSRQHKVRGGATAAARGPGLAEQSYLDSSSELFESTLHLTRDIAAMSVEAIAGYSYNDFIDEGFNAGGGDFIADNVTWNNFSFAQDFSQGEGFVGSFRSTHRLIGFFSRVNLNYDGAYFFNGSVRREGSSRFGKDNKWGLFWSAGLGVELSELTDVPGLSSLRVRASVGKTGQDAPSSGLSLQRFAPAGNFFVNGAFIQSFGPVSNPNPNLKWEEKTETNIGADFVTKNNRFSGRIDWYNATTSDLLFEVGVPVPPNLFPTTWTNVGTLTTSGLEFSLDYDILQGDGEGALGGLSWNSGLVASLYGETLLKEYLTEDVQYLASPGSPGLNNPDLIRIKQGEPIGQLWGPKFSRIGDNGEWLFLKPDGTEVTYGELTFPDDEQILGNGLPDYQIGWTNSMRFNNFDFGFFIEGVFGHQLANMFSLFYTAPKQISSYNVLKDAFDLVKLKDDPRWSSYYVENADYVRINNASIGYSVPQSALEGGPIRRLRFYLSVNNLATFTGYSGLNPQVRYVDYNQGQSEQGSSGGSLAPGIERRIEWFTTRSFSFGVNMNL